MERYFINYNYSQTEKSSKLSGAECKVMEENKVCWKIKYDILLLIGVFWNQFTQILINLFFCFMHL
jgi:hypothetical protein